MSVKLGISASAAAKCPKCARPIELRAGELPQYCPVCGQPLAEQRPMVRHSFTAAQRVSGLALAGVVLGILAFVPVYGAVFGVAAIVSGLVAGRRIRRSRGELGGAALAVAGWVMGLVGAVISMWLIGGRR